MKTENIMGMIVLAAVIAGAILIANWVSTRFFRTTAAVA